MATAPSRTADEISHGVRALVNRVLEADVTDQVARTSRDVASALADATNQAADRAGDAWKESRPVRRDAAKAFQRASRDTAKWWNETWRKELRPGARDLWKRRTVALGAAAREAVHAAKSTKAGQENAGATVIVVEGYVDVIAMVTAGFPATVAPLGTALTEDQLGLLWKMADEPVLCFDGDGAGVRAEYRAVDLALPRLKPGKSLKFALLPQGQDPDDLVRSAGREAAADVINAAKPLAAMLKLAPAMRLA